MWYKKNTKNKEKGIANTSKKEWKKIPDRKGWNCLDSDTNQKWIFQPN